jgi:hypothetical protein
VAVSNKAKRLVRRGLILTYEQYLSKINNIIPEIG